MVALDSSANITGIEAGDGGARITDCTLEVETWVPGESFGISPQVRAYVSRVVEVSDEGQRLRVEAIEVAHEGKIDSPGYGCVPEEMATQARTTVEEVLAELRVAQADPRVGLEALATEVADPWEAELASALAEQADLGYAITSPTEATLEVEGLDPRGLGTVVVVTACVAYPEGLVLQELGSGQVVREVFPPGTRDEMVLAVRLNGVDGPEVFGVVSEELPARC